MKVSIIIPVYNSSKYLKKCLDSVFNQTYKNIEVVIINDGSTDDSEKIIKDYMKKYKNIKYFYQKNKGQSVARNEGLKKSSGDFIMFVDSDDFIDTNMIEKLIDPMIKDEKIDLTFCNYYLYKNNKTTNVKIINNKNNDLIKELLISPPGPCVKLFKRKIINDFKFPQNIIYEDLAAIPLLIMNAKNVSYIDEYLYYYRQNDNSTVGKKSYSEKKLDILKASQYLFENFYKSKHSKIYKEEIDFLLIEHLIYYAGLRFIRYPKPSEKLKLISEFVKNNIPDYEMNMYYINLQKDKKKIIKNIANKNLLKCYIYLFKNKVRRLIK